MLDGKGGILSSGVTQVFYNDKIHLITYFYMGVFFFGKLYRSNINFKKSRW